MYSSYSPPNPSEFYDYTGSTGQFKNRATFHYWILNELLAQMP